MKRRQRNPGPVAAFAAMEVAKRTPTWVIPAALAAGAGVLYFIFKSPTKLVKAAGETAREVLKEATKTVSSFIDMVSISTAQWLGLVNAIEAEERAKEAEQMVGVIKTWEDGKGGVRDIYQRINKRSPMYLTADEAFFLVSYSTRATEAEGKNFNAQTIGIARGMIDQANKGTLKVIHQKDLTLQAILERDKKGQVSTSAERKWIFDEIARTEQQWKDGMYQKPGYRKQVLSMEAATIGGQFLAELRARLAAEEKAKTEPAKRVLKAKPKL